MFKKLLLFTILITSIFSQEKEEFSFIGATLSQNFIPIENSSQKEETTFGFRYGQQSIDWRTMFSYEGNDGLQTIALEIDTIFNESLFDYEELRLYLGGTYGGIKYKKVLEEKESKGKYYGVNVGFLLYFTDTIDIDIGYHYYKVSDFELLSNMKGVTLSLHYFY